MLVIATTEYVWNMTKSLYATTITQAMPEWFTVKKSTLSTFGLACIIIEDQMRGAEYERSRPWVLHRFWNSCTVSTDECSISFAWIGCTITEIRADYQYVAGKGRLFGFTIVTVSGTSEPLSAIVFLSCDFACF